MIEKLDLDRWEQMNKINLGRKINEIIGKMETFEANLLSISRILDGLLNRPGKDDSEKEVKHESP